MAKHSAITKICTFATIQVHIVLDAIYKYVPIKVELAFSHGYIPVAKLPQDHLQLADSS